MTSFDWSRSAPQHIIAASVNRICTVYDIEHQAIARQIQAHDIGTVNCLAYCGEDHNTFVSGGSDGFVRLFDLRCPNYFSVVFETTNAQGAFPILHTVVNETHPYQVAVVAQRTGSVMVLDSRKPKQVQAELKHTAQVNFATWYP